MSPSTTISPPADEDFLKDLLDRLTLALRQSHVSSDLIHQFQTIVHELVTPNHVADRRVICETVFSELCNLLQGHEILESKTCPNRGPNEGETLVVMFVGFQGSGKTTACAKFASYYTNRGWLPALVCADMHTPGALDKLKQEAAKNKTSVYGSHAPYARKDPGRYAKEAIDECKRDDYDLIIVDTSGLLEDMRKVYEAIRPDVVMLVIDGSVGQAAYVHVRTFEQNFDDVGGVITTKMNSCNAVGTLSAVAATKSRVAFTCTSPLSDLEEFDVKVTASRIMSICNSPVMKPVEGGDHGLRSMYGQVKNKVKKGRDWVKKKTKKVKSDHVVKIIETATDLGTMIKDIVKGIGRMVDDISD